MKRFAFQTLRLEKDKELKTQQKAFEKKESERAKSEQKKIAALEKKIKELEIAVAAGGVGAARPVTVSYWVGVEEFRGGI